LENQRKRRSKLKVKQHDKNYTTSFFPDAINSSIKIKDTEDFTLSLISDRASIKEGGLFIGAEIEYSGSIYTRVGISNFAVQGWLHGINRWNWY
jgi:hypothetical protein